MVLSLLALTPFAAALEIHHDLAAADHDGHEHSDTDLCQWVQHHTSGSILTGVPAVTGCQAVRTSQLDPLVLLLSVGLIPAGPPRGPPLP
jgi:hypothetical protein